MTIAHPTLLPAKLRWRSVIAVLGIVLVVSACGTDDEATQTSAEPPATMPDGADVTSQQLGDVTVHSYLGASAENGTYVVESESALVVIDTQYQDGDPEAFRSYIDDLEKPIEKVLITHDHPDHVGGLNSAFSDVPVATTAAVADLIDADSRDIEILEGSFAVDGVEYSITEYSDAEADAQMVVTLEEQDAIFTGDLAYNETHLFLTPELDNWISILDELRADSPANVFPGHGPPTDPAVYGDNIEYIRTAEANLRAATSAEDYTAAMIEAYPERQGEALIDFYAEDLVSKR